MLVLEVNLFRDELKFCCGGASFLAAPAILYCHLSIELHLGHSNQLKTVMSIRIGLHADPDSDADLGGKPG